MNYAAYSAKMHMLPTYAAFHMVVKSSHHTNCSTRFNGCMLACQNVIEFLCFGFTGTNPCGSRNGGCEYICLLSSEASNSYTCVCPDDMVLNRNGRDCSSKLIFTQSRTDTSPPKVQQLHSTIFLSAQNSL